MPVALVARSDAERPPGGFVDFNAGIGFVQMMGKTNYLALIGGGKSPKFAMNKVRTTMPAYATTRLPLTLWVRCQAIVWDDLMGKTALEIVALSTVRGIRLARERIVVVLQTSVRVYSFAKPAELLHVYETADNSLGLCCLSENKAAFPGRTPGQVQLVDLVTGSVNIIPAHASTLKALQLSRDGQLLASASETGTLIRVYATANCVRVAELRRGIDPATIFSLAFSPSGAMLACTSDKSTLHIFDIPSASRAHRSSANGDAGKWGILGRIPLMPRVFSDVYSFASVPFEAGNDAMVRGIPFSEGTVLGTTRPPKGVIAWISDDSLAVVGAGQDARWEKFLVLDGDDGRRHCVREGWKRYLGNT